MLKKVNRKSLIIRESGRSSDFITPSFGHGCLFNCTYCYMKRNKPTGLDYAENIEQILTEVNSHCAFANVDKPNQTHSKYITYDISCNEDFALHSKYYDWKYIFQFFVDHPIAMATLATKTIPKEFLHFNPKGKVRIRFSLMPEELRTILEPNTAKIINRIKAINDFVSAGYDVHINFSPVVIYHDWESSYKELFKMVDSIVEDKYKEKVLSEVIFLTHNKKKHEYNLLNGLPGEDLLWKPILQEGKLSSYGGENIRYARHFKKKSIDMFRELHNSVIPWNTIRYIF